MGSIENRLNILIVEDEDSKLAEWDAAIVAHNVDYETTGFLIDYSQAKSVSEAKHLLEFNSFDAAVVDLRLQREDGAAENNADGNHLIGHILESHPLGVVVYTGQSRDAEIPDYASPQVAILDKGDGLYPVIQWLGQNKDVFMRLRGAKAILNRETARMFFKSIWPRWKNWAHDNNKEQLNHGVARHVVAHIHDSLLAASNDSTHSEEAYFVPPLKARVDTGDLVRMGDKVWVVVTPRCDLANQGKVKNILFAACEDISEEWRTLVNSDSNASKDKVRKVMQHKGSHKLHFMFPLRDHEGDLNGPWMVNFDDLISLPVAEVNERLEEMRFASLSLLYLPSLVERLGAYFSRIGTPGFSSD